MFFVLNGIQLMEDRKISQQILRPCQGGGPMSPVRILKRLVSVFINACCLLSALPSLSQFGSGRLSRRNFILRSVATFSAMSPVGIYPGRASTLVEHILLKHFQWLVVSPLVCRCVPDCHVR